MPTAGLIVRNARVHPTLGRSVDPSDILVDGDRITSIRPAGTISADGRPELDAEGRLLSPPLVDPHVHMDAVLTVGEPRHNESGTLIEGIHVWGELKESLTAEDVHTHAQQRLASFKRPKSVVLAESLPKNPSGKILKRELREQHADLAR